MTRHIPFVVRSLVLAATLGVAAASVAAQSPASPAAPAPLTAADAKNLIGDWNIAADGPQGSMVLLLTIKAQADKTVAEISADVMGLSPITDITKFGDSVILRYSFDYQGSAIPAELTLTPSGDTLKAYFDFAGGAFTMPGVATRKKTS
jgi:hypothetical protein